jgi:CO/xanthine dehydrogenase Mo-binding subunit
LLGIGMASYVEVTNPMGSGEWASIEVNNDGGAIVRAGVSSHGQGLGTAFVMLASERTGIPIERMEYAFFHSRSRKSNNGRLMQFGNNCDAPDILNYTTGFS